MSPLVRKELRSIFPLWLLAMVLAILPVWLVWPGGRDIWAGAPGYLVYAPFAVGVLLLSLTPFGQELNWGTFSILLAQPVSRKRLWRVKVLLLGLALFLVFVGLVLSNQLRVDSVMSAAKTTVGRTYYAAGLGRTLEGMIAAIRHEALLDALMVGGLGAVAGLAGGLWTTLLFRQVSAAFWFTLLVPTGLGLLVGQLLGGFSDTVVRVGMCAVLGLYSAVGFVWARRLFQRVQDTQWTGGVVSVPEWCGSAAHDRTGVAHRKRQAFRALLRKELQSQYVNLLLAGALLLIHLAVLAMRALTAGYLSTHRSIAMILEAFPVLWLALPLLVASVAIAEERKLGTFETVTCLPVSRWRQFGIKLGLALGLGFILGAVVPLAVEQLGTLVGLHPNTLLAFGTEVLPAVGVTGLVALGITLLAFYSSSLTRNTLQALGSGVLACVIASLLIEVAAQPPNLWDVPLWGPRLLAWILSPVMLLALVVLAYRNYRHLQLNAKAWRRNGSVLLIGLLGVTIVASAIYHRFWEVWLPLEPPHPWRTIYRGARQANAPKLQASLTRMAALLPDGRLWLRGRARLWRKVEQGQNTFFVSEATGRVHAGFAPGSNWRDVAVSSYGCFAMQTDGSLWDLTGFQPGTRNAQAELKQVGKSRDWVKISPGLRHYCGLKSDGTLWEWSTPPLPAFNEASQKDLRVPAQVGTDTDWVAIAGCDQGTVAAKADGTLWRWGWVVDRPTNGPATSKTLTQPRKWLAFPGPQRPHSISFDGDAIAAVCDDGSLWLGGILPFRPVSPDVMMRARTEMVRCGTESDWEQVQLLGPLAAVGVRRDGSLWAWDIALASWLRDKAVAPHVPVSLYPVWVAACPYGSTYLTLGRDDTLCLWGDPEDDHYYDFSGDRLDPRKLLLASRIKAREIADLAP
jgi:ABC-type transport system involved in multi-copper enzyme maturation permease subunit